MSFRGTLMPDEGRGEPRFFYRGEVVGIGGWLHENEPRDPQNPMDEQWHELARVKERFDAAKKLLFGSRSLPYIGGEFEETVRDVQESFGGVEVRCRRIFCRISGRVADDGHGGFLHRTEVETRINDLTIVNQGRDGRPPVSLEIPHIGWQLTSSDPPSPRGGGAGQEPDTNIRLDPAGEEKILPTVRVGVNGVSSGELRPTFDSDLIRREFKFVNVKDRRPVPRPRGGGGSQSGSPEHAMASRVIRKGLALFSLVEEITPSGLPADGPGSIEPQDDLTMSEVHIKGLGTLSFGEIVVTPADRRIAMVHIRLGCLGGGTLTLSSGGTDGHTYP